VKVTIIEMGGKDTIDVDKDADLQLAADSIVKSVFGFSGQKCSACSRAVIHQDVYEEVKIRVVTLAKETRAGDPATNDYFTGPVIDEVAYKKIMSYIDL